MFILGFLLSSVPFFLPLRGFPNGDFYSDAASCLLVLLAASFVFRKFSVEKTSFFLILCACAFFVSGLIGGGDYLDVWFFPALALLWAATLISALFASPEKERDRFFLGLVYGLLLGGGISVFIALLQAHGSVRLLGALVFAGGDGVYANFGQRNNFSTYIMCFAAAVCWLASSGRLKFWLYLIAMFAAAYVLAVAGSRMVLLNSLLLILVLLCFLFYRKGESPVRSYSSYMLVFLILVAFFQIFLLWGFGGGGGGASRVTLSGDVARLNEWSKAWSIFLDHPLGVGVGGYAKNSFIYALGGESVGGQITWVHAHNIVMHFLVEFGVFSLPLFLYGALVFFVFFKKCLGLGGKGMMLVSCVIFIMVHSLLEYPLWYMNFFFLFFALIGVAGCGEGVKSVRIPSIRVVSFFLVLVLCFTAYSYSPLPSYRFPVKDMNVNLARMGVILQSGANPALSWSADKLALEYLIEDGGPELNYKLCQAITMAAREPLYPYLERIALLAIAGQDFDFASQVLKSRYSVYSSMPDTYLKARIQLLWPKYASEFISKIDQERLSGFPNHEYYRLNYPDRCL